MIDIDSDDEPNPPKVAVKPPSFDSDDEPMDPPKAMCKKPAVPKPPPSLAASPKRPPVAPVPSGHPTKEQFDNLMVKYAAMERMLQQLTLHKASPPSTPPMRSPSSTSLSERPQRTPAGPAAVKTPPPPPPAAAAAAVKMAPAADPPAPKVAPPPAPAEPALAIDPEMERVYSLDAEAHY